MKARPPFVGLHTGTFPVHHPSASTLVRCVSNRGSQQAQMAKGFFYHTLAVSAPVTTARW